MEKFNYQEDHLSGEGSTKEESVLPIPIDQHSTQVSLVYQKEAERADQERINQLRIELGIETQDEQISRFIRQLPKVGEYIDLSQLSKVGEGGTHDVYLYEEDQRFVVKVNKSVRGVAKKVVESFQNQSQELDQYVQDENQRIEQVQQYFGVEHCLPEKILPLHVKRASDDEGKLLLVSIQKTSQVFNNPNRINFCGGFAEKDPLVTKHQKTYDKMNTSLLAGGPFNEQDYLQFNDKLITVFELIDQDLSFAECVTDFLLKFKNYHNATGELLDFIGEENVLFYQNQNEQWDFQLGTVVKGETKEGMAQARQALETDPALLNKNVELRNLLMAQLAVIRLINATGYKVGIGKVIDTSFSQAQINNLKQVEF